MDLKLDGKVAIVTGGSKGIGRAVALELAAEGAHVVISARHADALAATAETIHQSTGREVHIVRGDMTKAADITRMVDETIGRFGRVDILIANAGLSIRGDILSLAEKDIYFDLDLHYMGLIRCCRAVIPHMQKNRWGRIVIMAAKAGMEPLLHIPLTSAGNAAQINLGKSLARLYSKEGILVNTLNVGPIWTDLAEESTRKAMKETGKSMEQIITQRGQTAVGRSGRPEEVAAVTVFLCSERASFVTGAGIEVDGGTATYM
jgi:3-oxoacyl-[acyl-carrier protein] reductase